MLRLLYILSFLACSCSALLAQQACPPVPVPSPDPAKLLLTAQQETDLGDAMAERMQRYSRVIDDPDLTGYLQRVGERVASTLPETNLHYRFYIYDLPGVQAYSVVGARVYVSRKMVSFLRDEDELAALLGHELGHIVARQPALQISRRMREVLNVQQLGDRKDVYDKYNLFLENIRTKHVARTSEEAEAEQLIADRIGVQAIARAGYPAHVFADLFDRLAQTKGKTGNWFAEAFGLMTTNEKRLREIVKDVGTVPPACVKTHPNVEPADFLNWQNAVVHYKGIGHKEFLPGVLTRTKLNDPMHGDVDQFLFSPDGKYLLVQDDANIYIFTREPFALKFQIDSPRSYLAHFSPDSRRIVFYSTDFHVQTWDIEQQEQLSFDDVVIVRGCRSTLLSPEGNLLACYGSAYDMTIYDVSTSQPFFQREKFFNPTDKLGLAYQTVAEMFAATSNPLVHMRFSPDQRYFVAGAPGSESAVDLSSMKEVSLPASVRALLDYGFTFLGPDRLIGLNWRSPEKSAVVSFPAGEEIDRIPLGEGRLTPASDPRYLLIRPLKEHAVGALNLQSKRIELVNRNAAFDIWNDIIVSERLTGEIGLYHRSEKTPFQTAQLPIGAMGRVQARSASPDLKWLALSNRSRSAVWNTETGQRVFFSRAFRNAHFASSSQLLLDFPKFENAQHELGILNLSSGELHSNPVPEDDKAVLFGEFLVRTTHREQGRDFMRNMQIDVLEPDTHATLWTRNFPKRGPTLRASVSNNRMVLMWPANSDGARDEIDRDPRLHSRYGSSTFRDEDLFLEVVDGSTGATLGGTVVVTGKASFLPLEVFSVADWIVIGDTANRVLLYSLATGEEKARFFGSGPVLSPTGGLLCAANESGQLTVYDLATLGQRSVMQFGQRIVTERFSEDSKHLFVFTEDQSAYTIEVQKKGEVAASAH